MPEALQEASPPSSAWTMLPHNGPMDPDASALLRHLLHERPIAALATLHRGEPATSMVPFVLSPSEMQLLIHVSALATHTRDMLEHPRVSVLVTAEVDGAVSPQALPRASFVADAVPLEFDGSAYLDARERYLARFPDAVQTFALGDFSMFALRLQSARLVAGFGRAYGLAGESLEAVLRSTPSP
jgi:heme iron utilization protein